MKCFSAFSFAFNGLVNLSNTWIFLIIINITSPVLACNFTLSHFEVFVSYPSGQSASCLSVSSASISAGNIPRIYSRAPSFLYFHFPPQLCLSLPPFIAIYDPSFKSDLDFPSVIFQSIQFLETLPLLA